MLFFLFWFFSLKWIIMQRRNALVLIFAAQCMQSICHTNLTTEKIMNQVKSN